VTEAKVESKEKGEGEGKVKAKAKGSDLGSSDLDTDGALTPVSQL
jgi:hypothetical protein